MIKKIQEKFGIDKAIGFTVLSRLIQAGGGVLSMLLISFFLTPEEQGFYFTFGSIVALQIFFELGLNTIITQYVAHEAVHLHWASPQELSGDPVYLSRLASLLHFCLKIFSALAVVLFFVLEFSGNLFFGYFQDSTVDWQLPWQLVALSTTLTLLVNPFLSFLEGLGKVKEMAGIRLVQQIVNILTLAIVFLLHGGLFALGIASLASFLVLSGGIIFSVNRPLLASIYKKKAAWLVNYRTEIFPYQWKIALSWISGYFIFQLFNPVLFATEGPVVAGQMGMTLAALNAISALSMSWINTKVPKFSSLIAQKKYAELDQLLGITVKQLLSVNAMLVGVFLMLVGLLQVLQIPLGNRFLGLLPVALLSATVIVNQLIFSWATYLRSHKQEPFLLNSIVGGVLCGCSTLFLGKVFGMMGIVIGYTILTLFVGLPWGYLVFRMKRAEWHLN